MRDVSLHLLDIIENSAKAGASRIVVHVELTGEHFSFTVSDDGPGLPPHVATDPLDPYRTTRSERPVGLGLAFLREAAEQTGGSVSVSNRPGQGVTVQATFCLTHIDAKPLGDLPGALATAAIGWSSDLAVTVGDPENLILDSGVVRRELDGVPLSHPRVREFIEGTLSDELGELMSAGDRVFSEGHASGITRAGDRKGQK